MIASAAVRLHRPFWLLSPSRCRDEILNVVHAGRQLDRANPPLTDRGHTTQRWRRGWMVGAQKTTKRLRLHEQCRERADTRCARIQRITVILRGISRSHTGKLNPHSLSVLTRRARARAVARVAPWRALQFGAAPLRARLAPHSLTPPPYTTRLQRPTARRLVLEE